MKTRTFVGLGEVLVSRGVITAAQLDTLLTVQEERHRPLGELAEVLLSISPRQVEEAWTQQYLSGDVHVDLDQTLFDPYVAKSLDRRQAWQFEVLPLQRRDGYLIVATSAERLARAVPFAWAQFGEPVMMVVAPRAQLRAHLQLQYPRPTMAKFDPRAVAEANRSREGKASLTLANPAPKEVALRLVPSEK